MSNSRRDFIKKTVTSAVVLPMMGGATGLFAGNFQAEEWQNLEDAELLEQFSEWVDAYVVEIKKEKSLGNEFKNNRALVDLPAQMDEMMPVFKQRFSNQDFLKSYLQISRKLTNEIDDTF